MLGVLVVLGLVVLLSVALTIVQFRKITPLAFRCAQCRADFTQPPHRDYPAQCPRCGRTDWALRSPLRTARCADRP